MTRTGWEGGCARIESKERGEGGFVGTKFFGFKFPRKLALQNYSQLPRRARNLSMVRACVCARDIQVLEQAVRNSVEKYLLSRAYEFSTRARAPRTLYKLLGAQIDR